MSKIVIKPYVEKNKLNSGLEQYNEVVVTGTKHDYEMVCLQEGSTNRYLTGLNPFASELNKLTKDEREAKIEQIKKIVIKVESSLGGQIIDESDSEWWNKVKILKPDNISFWGSNDMLISLNNEPLILNISTNNLDLLKYYSIKAGGYPEIAISYEDANNRITTPKFYLEEEDSTVTLQVQVSKLRNKAGAELDKLYNKNINKLFYVCKVIDPNSIQYKTNTSTDVFYQNMDKYINGETVDSDKKKTAQNFIDVCNLDMETLKLRAIVKDGTYYKYLALKGDGMIYHMSSGSAMGKNTTQVVEFLKNPLNDEILKSLLKSVEEMWKM